MGTVLLDAARPHARRARRRAARARRLDAAGRRRPAPAGAGAGGAEAARGRARPRRCRSAGTRPGAPRATTCASPATAASGRRCRRCALRGVEDAAAAPARALVLEGALGGQDQLALVEHPPGRRAAEGRPVPAHAPDRAARDRRRGEQRHRCVRRLEGQPRASRATSCWPGSGKVLARGAAAPITAQGLACATMFVLRACARSTPPATSRRPPPSPARGRAPCTDHAAPAAPGNVRAITVADTSVALAWDRRASTPTAPCAATPSTATACCSASRTATGFLARNLAPATPYRFTVAAIDGAGHRSPDGAARHRDAGAAARDRPGLRLHARDDRLELRGPAAPLPPDRGRLADLLPRSAATSRSSGQDDPLVTGWARLRGIKVEPRVEIAGSDDPAHAARERGQPHQPGRAHLRRSWRCTATTASTSTSRAAPPPTARCSRPSSTELAQTLHAQGATLTMAVAAKTGAGADRARRLLRLPGAGRRRATGCS